MTEKEYAPEECPLSRADRMVDIIDRTLEFESRIQRSPIRPCKLCRWQMTGLATDLKVGRISAFRDPGAENQRVDLSTAWIVARLIQRAFNRHKVKRAVNLPQAAKCRLVQQVESILSGGPDPAYEDKGSIKRAMQFLSDQWGCQPRRFRR